MNKDYTNDSPFSQKPKQTPPHTPWYDEITETPNPEVQEADIEFIQFKQEFLPLIWPDGHGFPYFCRFKPRMDALWQKDVELAELLTLWPQSDIYFGVATGSAEGTNKQRVSLRGQIFPHTIGCFFADFDAADYDPAINEAKKAGKQIDITEAKAKAWEALNDAQNRTFEASMILDTGGGFQAFWLLSKPIVITDENRRDIELLMKHLCGIWGGDQAVKDLARVLRVPGTLNVKPHYLNGPFPCRIVKLNARLRYPLKRFQKMAIASQAAKRMPLEEVAKQSAKSKTSKPIPTQEGGRGREDRRRQAGSKNWKYELAVATQCFESLDVTANDENWYRIVLGLAGTFAGSPVEQALFERLDKWSQGSSRYNEASKGGRAYLERRWQEIKERQEWKKGKAGIGSVITLARAQDPAYDEKLKKRLASRTIDPLREAIEKAENAEALTDMLPDFVALALNLKATDLTKICHLLKKKGVKPSDISQFRSDIKATKRENEQKRAPKTKVHESELDEEFNLLVYSPLDDAGHAESFLALHPNQFVTVDEWGLLAWDGKKWEKRGAKAKLFSRVRRHLKARVKAATQARDMGLIDDKRLDTFWAQCSRGTARINAVVTQVMLDETINKAPERFDKYHMYLNCKSGILDIGRMQLYLHDPTYYFTTCAPVEIAEKPDMTPLYNWLDSLQLSEEVETFLQKWAGYCLTGSTKEECFLYISGPKRSGKGTYADMLKAVLGKPLSNEISAKTLMRRNNSSDAQNFALAPLKPCRFIAVQETGKYHKFRTEEIKNLTGGDAIYCAHKGKPHFSYKPKFKITITSNKPPRPDDVTDEAFWQSRLRYIRFHKSFLGQEDKALKDERIKTPEFKSAFLAWALDGAQMWLQDGHMNATSEMVWWAIEERGEQDQILQWIEEECNTDTEPNTFTSHKDLYQAYEAWANANGITPRRKRQFTRELREKGYVKKKKSERINAKVKTQYGYYGIEPLLG